MVVVSDAVGKSSEDEGLLVWAERIQEGIIDAAFGEEGLEQLEAARVLAVGRGSNCSF